jgi:hypothetical protein
MRFLLLLGLVCCAPGRAQRPVNPRALEGVTLGLMPPTDLRQTPGIGCGQISRDLALRAHQALIAAFSDAGATASNSDLAPWTLAIVLREAGMGLENAGTRRSDKPVQDMPEDAPSLNEPRASLFNSGNENAAVVLDATLARGSAVVWRGTVTGHARSAPCVEAIDKVREALADAIDELREHVIARIRGP